MRRPIAIALVTALGLACGCYAYRPATLTPAPGARVRITLTTATTVTSLSAGDSAARRGWPGILEASGTIQAAGADTIALRLGELRSARGPVAGIEGQIALIPVAGVARIEERRFQAGTTLLGGAGLLTLAAAAALAVLLAAIFKGF